MKTFCHVPIELEELKTQTIDKKRFYETPEGELYPSITTVLSVRNKKGLFEWRKRVGDDVANYVARTSAARGTAVHHMCEDYLNNESMKEHEKKFLPYCLFGQLQKKVLHKINNIRAQECGLYSDKYKVAGRVDCIGMFKGKPAIIDFKTANKRKERKWIGNYFMQEAAYAVAFEEMTKIPITQLVTVIAVTQDEPQLFIERRDDHIAMFQQWRGIYKEKYGV